MIRRMAQKYVSKGELTVPQIPKLDNRRTVVDVRDQNVLRVDVCVHPL